MFLRSSAAGDGDSTYLGFSELFTGVLCSLFDLESTSLVSNAVVDVDGDASLTLVFLFSSSKCKSLAEELLSSVCLSRLALGLLLRLRLLLFDLASSRLLGVSDEDELAAAD